MGQVSSSTWWASKSSQPPLQDSPCGPGLVRLIQSKAASIYSLHYPIPVPLWSIVAADLSRQLDIQFWNSQLNHLWSPQTIYCIKTKVLGSGVAGKPHAIPVQGLPRPFKDTEGGEQLYILDGKNQQTDWQSTATSPSILETTGAGRQPSASSRCGRPARLTHASPAYFPLEDKFPTLSAMSEDLAWARGGAATANFSLDTTGGKSIFDLFM